jgi:hypothetical protein
MRLDLARARLECVACLACRIDAPPLVARAFAKEV